MQGYIAGLSTANNVNWFVSEASSNILSDQQDGSCTIGYRGTVEQTHGPGDDRVYPIIM